jgi:hypothetical protein
MQRQAVMSSVRDDRSEMKIFVFSKTDQKPKNVTFG